MGLDRDRALRERAQLLASEPDHLAGAVAFRSPRHPETFGQGPFELVQEHGPGGLAPDVQRVGVERHVLPVRSAHHVRNQAVGVQLRVPGPAGAMRERRNREPVGPDPSSDATLLLTSERRTILQELERDLGRLDHRDRHHRRGLGSAERPQQRHRLRDTTTSHRSPAPCGPDAQPTVDTSVWIVSVHQRAQRRRRSTTPSRPRASAQRPAPHTRRLAGAHVVVLQALRHRRDQILRPAELGDRQHVGPAVSPGATPKGWQVPDVEFGGRVLPVGVAGSCRVLGLLVVGSDWLVWSSAIAFGRLVVGVGSFVAAWVVPRTRSGVRDQRARLATRIVAVAGSARVPAFAREPLDASATAFTVLVWRSMLVLAFFSRGPLSDAASRCRSVGPGA